MLRQSKMVNLLPGLAGLFFARLLLEGWGMWRNTAVALPIVLSTSLLLAAGLAAFLRSQPFGQTWPLLLLLLYLFVPEPVPRFALGLLVVVLLTIAMHTSFTLPHMPRLEAAAVAVIAFLFYLLTVSPAVLTADNGEFQWVGALGGVMHPPGFPLYTMLVFLFARLPLPLSAAYKITLFSTLTSSITLAFLYLTLLYLSKRRLAALTAVVTLATATTFWSQAANANIRSLTALCATAALYFLVQLPTTEGKAFDRRLLYAVLATGLGVVHHPSLVFFAVIFLFFVVWVDAEIVRSWRRLRPLAAAVLLSLLPMLYLPLRAGADAPGARESLATWRGFWNHALALGFSGDLFYFVEPAIFVERLRVMTNVLTFQFSPWLLLGMGLGFVLLLREQRRLAFLLGGSFFLHLVVTATYRAPQTVEYMLPAYLPLVIFLGVAVGEMVSVHRRLAILNFLGPIAAAVLLVVAVGEGAARWNSFRAVAESSNTQDYVNAILRDAPDDALLLTDWHWYTPLRYAQEVDGVRPDMEIRFVAPEGPSYGAAWRERIATGLANGRNVVATHSDPLFESLPPPLPLGEAFLFQNEPASTIPDGLDPVESFRAGDVGIVALRLADRAAIGDIVPVTVAWQTEKETSLFVHLVGFDGRLYAQDDQTIQTGSGVTRLEPVLRPGSEPGEFAVYIGSGSERVQVGTVSATAAPFAPVTRHPHHLTALGEARTLVGHDWDQTLPNQTRLYLHWQTTDGFYSTVYDDQAIASVQPVLLGAWGRAVKWTPPQPDGKSHYVPFGRGIVWLGGDLLDGAVLRPGQTLTPRLRFGSRAPIFRDTAVSVRLIGFEADQFTWAWTDLNDSIPALGAIPTLKWISGSRVVSPHQVTIAPNANAGQTIGLTLRLYDAFTNRPLPILDERIAERLPWVPVDQGVME